jgi:hypothetical protein
MVRKIGYSYEIMVRKIGYSYGSHLLWWFSIIQIM